MTDHSKEVIVAAAKTLEQMMFKDGKGQTVSVSFGKPSHGTPGHVSVNEPNGRFVTLFTFLTKKEAYERIAAAVIVLLYLEVNTTNPTDQTEETGDVPDTAAD